MIRRHLSVAALVLAMVVAACGQKPGVHVAGSGGGAAAGEGELTTDLGTGEVATETGDAAAAGGAAGATGGAAAGGAAAGGAAAGPGAAAGATGPRKVIGTNRTGVTADKITVALHAPITGAAPVPAESFEKARDLYWRYITEMKNEKVLGRSKVEVLFKDDRYQPSTAVQACRELASSAFLLVGGAGTDQIQACGRFAESAKVPYLSAGVTENGLRGLKWYYAASMSYKQQGALLAQYVKKTFGGKKVAAIITDTPNFDDAAAGWDAARAQQALTYYKTLRHPRGDTSWYSTYANELKGQNVEVVYINSAPVDYLRFADTASQQGFTPEYVGVGISMGLNVLLGSGCPELSKGTFFSPFPGLDYAQKNYPEFFQAAQRFGVTVDDLALALWGLAKTEHEMFKRYEATYGKDLTREDFRALVETQTGMKTGVFPDVSFTPTDHFGARQVHVLRADCAAGKYNTLATFQSGF